MPKAETQGSILIALSRGAVITVEYINEPPSAVRKVYRLSSNNRAVRAPLVQRMLDDGLIKPNNDGLPGIGETQTFSMVRSSDSPQTKY